MELERGSTRIYRCPFCGVDTPHVVRARRGSIYGVVCANCESGALVDEDDLQLYQMRWEEELRQILDSLEQETGDGYFEDY